MNGGLGDSPYEKRLRDLALFSLGKGGPGSDLMATYKYVKG